MAGLACLGWVAGCVVTMPMARAAGIRDLGADTWVATDALGRSLPEAGTVPEPRAGRTVAMFYFLWHGAHIQGGPYDIRRILGLDPGAMQRADSGLWGPLHAPHHWGRSIFGYYRTADAGVLRKHAQMLSDAGVDVVVFDVTNQVTYRDDYRALLREWGAMRALGNRTPQVAFLTPFWDPSKVVRELWRDLYSTGASRELWFEWEGKPLLLADPELVAPRVAMGRNEVPAAVPATGWIGQTFEADRPFLAVGGQFPTWRTTDGAVTLVLRKEDGTALRTQRFEGVTDNGWLELRTTEAWPAGRYRLEAGEASGRVGWWTSRADVDPGGAATADGAATAGDRSLRWSWVDPETEAILRAFTFRKPQPDYFEGPTRPGMWSWLEVSPQHVFRNAAGEKEQMSVGVAQNAVGRRLGSMSEAGARGRSHTAGRTDTRPGAVRLGLNFDEQWRRAVAEDPRVVFVTGWNEWIAGRFAEFAGVRAPVMFVDQFDQEHSRDIEPMVGGHGDDYHWQFVGWVRRFKGARRPEPVVSRPITIDGNLGDWTAVTPEFRDTAGDPVVREHPGWGEGVVYRNRTGRNDMVTAKASVTEGGVAFLAVCREPLRGGEDDDWMVLYLDTDAEASTGWMGFDLAVNRRRSAPGVCTVERNVGGRFEWAWAGEARWGADATGLEVLVPWGLLGGAAKRSGTIDFKWTDHCHGAGDWTDFTLNGDAAPNDRFKYRARWE